MRFDHVLVGGGLQNGLIALGLLHHDPAHRLAIIERAPRIGGNHTWCFHAADVDPAAAPWVDALPGWRWSGYTVRFPDHERSLEEPYAMIASTAFAAAVEAAVAAAPNAEILTDAEATRIEVFGPGRGEAEGARVELADGRVIEGHAVIDARGPDRAAIDRRAGYQIFVGLEVELTADHGLIRPLLMDATVPQIDGFRFFYLLPLDNRRLLVEDTRFTDSPALDAAALEAAVLDSITARGWTIHRRLRHEQGILPLPWAATPPPPRDGILRAGFAGGFFHPATGYSFPLATRVSALVATTPIAELPARLDALRAEVRRRQRFCHLLNRAMFAHCEPAERWQLMSRFYRRPAPLIRRFYALRMTRWDRFLSVAGPIPRCLRWHPRPLIALEEKAA